MKLVLLSTVLALFAAPAARAGEPGAPAGGPGACKADMEKFCEGVEPGEGRLKKCLKEHEAELSEGCRAMAGKMKEKRQQKKDELEAACKEDKERLCKGVEPGEGRQMKCMKEHEAELSEKCKAMSGKMKEKHEAMKAMKDKAEACKADKERFCKDVQPGEGRLIECLKAHEAELSEGCRAAKMSGHGKKDKAPEPKKG